MASTFRIRRLTLAFASAWALTGAAEAQTPPAVADAAAPERKGATEEIVVTGTRIRRKDLNTPAPVAVLTREEMQASGKLTLGDFLQTLPEQGNAPNFQLNNGGATYDADGATRVNLRSLGIARTLVLVNGRRMVSSGFGANSSGVDLNTIPVAAVERIEVLKDGASAIYGSDAIGGVVNVITRKSYSGTEVAATAGTSSRNDAQTYDLQLTTGRTTDAGGLLFSVGYNDQKSSWLRDRTWAAHALSWDYAAGGSYANGSGRTPWVSIALPSDVNGNELPACAANPVCHALVLSDPTWNQDTFIRDPSAPNGYRVRTTPDRYNYAAENYLTIPSTRVQIFSAGDSRIGAARAYYEASYVQTQTQQNAAPMPLNPGDYTLPGSSTPISVSGQSYYNPFGVDLPFAGRRLVEFGHRTYTQGLETFRVVGGLDGTMPESLGPLRGWFWDASLNYGRTGGAFTTGGAIRNSKIADAVGPSFLDTDGVVKCGTAGNVIAGCVPLNIFSAPNSGGILPSQIDNLGFTGTSRAEFQILSASLNAAGELVSISSDRAVSLAVGYEHRRQSGAQIADPIAASGDSADFNFKTTRGSYSSNEAYAELLLPILAGAPWAEALEASLAARYVDFSSFGSHTSFKVGARWSPIRDVTVRGTYSTAFRAPTINELYLGQAETAPNATDPCNYNPATVSAALKAQCDATTGLTHATGDDGTQELAHVGGNAKLKAETAKILTAGLVLEPQMLKGLSFTLDYYQTQVDNVVGTIGLPSIIAGCYPAASGSTAASYQPYCALITRAPTSGRILFIADVNQNVGVLKTAGVDFAASYLLPTSVGRFRFGLNGTWLSYFDRTQELATGNVTVHGKGNFDLGAMPPLKANLSAAWTQAGWTAGAVGRYVASFKECSGSDHTSDGAQGLCNGGGGGESRQVGNYVVIDLNGATAFNSSMGRTTVGVGINNLFDRKPNYVYSAPLANSDPATYDFLGRYYYLRLAHSF